MMIFHSLKKERLSYKRDISAYASSPGRVIFDDILSILRAVPLESLPGFINKVGVINHVIISLYLVTVGARRCFLEVIPDPSSSLMEAIQHVSDKYGLTIGYGYRQGIGDDDPMTITMLVCKEPIDENLINNDMYRAEMLDYGCVDPRWNDLSQPRIMYRFLVTIDELEYGIMVFVCPLPRLSDAYLLSMKNKLQQGIGYIDPSLRVRLISRVV